MSNNLFLIINLIEEKYNIDVPGGSILPGKLCFQEKLSIEQDNSININKLKSIEHLYELGNPLNKEELEYVEAKIIKFITTNPFDIAECFELYSIAQDVCNKQGLSTDLMGLLADLINLKRDVPVGDNFVENMHVVEVRLAKYIPDILKNIIDISETYEKNNCNKISENTLLMKKLYSTIIKKNASHKDYKLPDINIGEYFNSFQSNIFTKIALLVFFAYIIGKIIGTFNVQYKINPGK